MEEDLLAEVEREFKDFSCEIKCIRKFDGEKFVVLFTSSAFGTCGSVQTDEQKAFDGGVRLLEGRLIDAMLRHRQAVEPPPHWMAL